MQWRLKMLAMDLDRQEHNRLKLMLGIKQSYQDKHTALANDQTIDECFPLLDPTLKFIDAKS
jgi:hypothetical protein